MEGSGYGRTDLGGAMYACKAMIDLGRLGIVGHPTTIDNELVCHLVSVWDEEVLGSSRACRCGGESWCRQRCGDEDWWKESGDARHDSEWNKKEAALLKVPVDSDFKSMWIYTKSVGRLACY